jgi:hypothetical protein
MCHGDIDFEAYEIGRAYQFFKLVSLSLREADNPYLLGPINSVPARHSESVFQEHQGKPAFRAWLKRFSCSVCLPSVTGTKLNGGAGSTG